MYNHELIELFGLSNGEKFKKFRKFTIIKKKYGTE